MLLNSPLGVDSTPRPKKRYWRIFVTDTNYSGGSAGDAVAIAEVTWTDFFGASVPKPGTVTVTADSQFSGSYSADKAYDNNTASFWSGYGPAIPGWLKFDFGAGAEFCMTQVAMRARNDSLHTQMPRDFQIQYSADGTTWTTYWQKAGAVWSAGLQQTFAM